MARQLIVVNRTEILESLEKFFSQHVSFPRECLEKLDNQTLLKLMQSNNLLPKLEESKPTFTFQ
jgi:hypothetical protein